jgi:hypothetical protein
VRRLATIPSPSVAALVLAAVPGGGIYALRPSGDDTTPPSPVAVSEAHAPAAVPRPNGEASKDPQQILLDAASALRAATGFELQGGTSQGGGQRMRLLLMVSAPRSLDLSASVGPDAYEMLSVPQGYYARASAHFWRRHLGVRGAILADRWIQTSSS